MLEAVSSVVRTRGASFIAGVLLAFGSIVSKAATGSITLAWDASTSSSVVGYNLYYGGVSGTYTNVSSAGNVTTATVSNLVIGTTYYFAATAYDVNGLESDYSAEVSGSIPLPTSTNAPPTLNALVNLTINEGAGLQTVNLGGISSGATNEVQTLAVTATSSNPSLIPNPTVSYTSPNATGSLTFTPVALNFGSATVTVTVNDGGASNNIVNRSFTVTVNPVNQPPTLNALANTTINESAGLQTVNLSGIGSGAANENQTLAVTATSSNPSLIPNPSVTYTSPNATGSLTFTPVALAFGSTTITVTVNDGGTSNNIVSRSFTVTVNSVNQPPTLNALANVAVNANAGLQTVALSGISSGAANEVQTLTVTAVSSKPGIVPNPTVNYSTPSATGSLTFTPVTSASGSATITVTVNDGGTSNNVVSRTFSVTVNQPPTISSMTNLVIAMNTATPALPFTIADVETSASALTLSATSDNAALAPNSSLMLAGTGASRTLTVTPLTGQTGTAHITLTVSDGSATATSVFQLMVAPRPTPPGNLHVASQ